MPVSQMCLFPLFQKFHKNQHYSDITSQKIEVCILFFDDSKTDICLGNFFIHSIPDSIPGLVSLMAMSFIVYKKGQEQEEIDGQS